MPAGYPQRYSRVTDFNEAELAGSAFSTQNLDSEFDDLVTVTDELNDWLRGITNADGTLKNLTEAEAAGLAGTFRFVATAAQTVFVTTLAWDAAFTAYNVLVSANGVVLDPNTVSVSNVAGFLTVTLSVPRALNDLVVMSVFIPGSSLLTRLADTSSLSNGASMIGINDPGNYYSSTNVENALQEVMVVINTYKTNVGTLSNLFKADGSRVATGNFQLGAKRITGMADGIANTDAVTVQQLSAATAAFVALLNVLRVDGTNAMTANLNFGNHKGINVQDPTAAQDAATKNYVDGLRTNDVLIGEIKPYAGASAPNAKWLLCDGSSISSGTYPDLFAVVGTTYGGTGTPNFKLPDMRGRVLVGAGTGFVDPIAGTGSLTARTRGAYSGEENHALTAAENGPHAHGVPASGTPGTDGFANVMTNLGTLSTTTSGGGNPHNNMQPFGVVNYLIRALP